MSESQAGTFIRVSRAATQVPELFEAIEKKETSLSHSLAMAAVLTDSKTPIEEKKAWIEKSKTCSRNELQEMLASEKPDSVTRDSTIRKKSQTQSSVTLYLNEEEVALFKQLQTVMRSSKLKEAIVKAAQEIVNQKDPVKKAERIIAKKPTAPLGVSGNGKSIPANIAHQVHLRDRGKCTECGSKHFTELHHVLPRSKGGQHTVENLKTLCHAHHRMIHSDAHRLPPKKKRADPPGISPRL